MVDALGSPDPSTHLRLLLALVDGLLANQLANPAADFDPTAAIATLLNGMLPGGAGVNARR